MSAPRRMTASAAAAAVLAAAVALGGAPARPGADARPLAVEPAAQAFPGGEAGYINFSFDQVDIRAFVKLVGDLTGREFVVADGVTGRITVVAPRIGRKDVYPLFVSILESVGCAVVEKDRVVHVVALGPRAIPAAPVVGEGKALPAQGVITRIIRLEHVSAQEMRKALEGKVGGGKGGAIAAVDETNHLIVTDTADSIRRIEEIIAQIDRPGMTRLTEVVPLQYASAEEMARQLSLAIADSETRGELLRRRLPAPAAEGGPIAYRATVVAAPHSNSLLLAGTSSQIEEMKRIVALMDVDTRSGRGRLNAIFLKYIAAEEAAKSINGLLDKSTGKAGTGGEAQRRISIEASAANNALLVDAMPGDFDVVQKLIEQLDQVPDQVLIEVLIAEIGAGEDFSLGAKLSAVNFPGPGGTLITGGTRVDADTDGLLTRIQQGMFPQGITVGVAQGVRNSAGGISAAGGPAGITVEGIRKNSRFHIVSETSLEAQDNREANVKVVNEIPILKSTIQGGAGTARDVVQNIDRMEVGIKLKLTPHVIEGGGVRMTLNPSIEAVIDPGPAGTQFAPTVAKREVSTTVTVPDGQMIVIAGLTREDKTKSVRKVPLLGSLPVVGMFFRYASEGTEKTNMLIFVTPRIVTRMADAEKVMKEWRRKTGLEQGAAGGGEGETSGPGKP